MKLKKVIATSLVAVFTVASMSVYSPMVYADTLSDVAEKVGLTESQLTKALDLINIAGGVVTKEMIDSIGDFSSTLGEDVVNNVTALASVLNSANQTTMLKDGNTFKLTSDMQLSSDLTADQRRIAQSLIGSLENGLELTDDQSALVNKLLIKNGVTVTGPVTNVPDNNTQQPAPPNNDSSTTVTPPAVTPPATDSSDSTAPTLTSPSDINVKDGGATVEVSAHITDKALDNLIGELNKQEEKGTVPSVAIQAVTTENEATLSVPANVIDTIFNNTSANVDIVSDLGTLSFDTTALGAISDAISKSTDKNTTVKFNIAAVESSSLTNLSEGDAAKLEGRPVFDFSVTVNGRAVGNFKSGGKAGNVKASVPYTLNEGENSNALVVYYVSGAGKMTPVRSAYKNGKMTMTLNHFSKYVIAYNAVEFKDVAENSSYHKAITFGAAQGYLNPQGMGDGYFEPETKATRAMLLIIVMNAFGISPDKNVANNFDDVDSDSYYAGYTAAAKRLGIVHGVNAEGTIYEPERAMTNEEMYIIFYNLLTYLEVAPVAPASVSVPFYDFVTANPDAMPAIKALISADLIPTKSGKLSPKEEATRAAMADLLYTLLTK